MAGLGQKIYTSVLTNSSFTFTQDMGILGISMQLVSGVGTFTGTLTIGTNVSSPIDLVAGGTPVTITSDSGNPLDGITIDCSGGGVINILARQ